MNIDPSIILAFVAVLLGGGGIAAYRRSEKEAKEADNQSAQAAANMVAAADAVVTLLRREMGEQQRDNTERLDMLMAEIQGLKDAVTAWDGWADRVLDILDKALGLLTTKEKADLRLDVTHVQDTRPPRHHRYHDKTGPRIGVHAKEGT